MRVTNKVMTNTYTKYLNQNLASMQESERQLMTGKLYSRPSQNPYATTRVMGYESEIRRYKQYEKNVIDIESTMDVSDGALENVNTMFKRVRELALQGENGSMDDTQREILADEIDQILEGMVSAFNSSVDNQYVFGGTATDKPPFEIATDANGNKVVNYLGNGDSQKIEVSPGIRVDKYLTGDHFLQQVNGRNLFEGIIDLSKALRDNDTNTINALTEDLLEFENIVLEGRGIVGATQARMEMAKEKIAHEITSLTKVSSTHGDTDYASKLVEYNSQKALYEASLQISTNILKPNLMQFLK